MPFKVVHSSRGGCDVVSPHHRWHNSTCQGAYRQRALLESKVHEGGGAHHHSHRSSSAMHRTKR